MKSMIAMIAALAMITSVATAQFPEGFETATLGTATCGTTNPGVFPAGWISGGNNPFLVDNNGTGSTNTGPSAANTGTNYVHIETSCAAGDWVGELEMPMIDATGLTNPTLDFAYHMFGAAMGSLEVQVFTPGAGICGADWTTVWYLAGDQTDLWIAGQANLAPGVDANNMVRARFVGTRGTSFTSDIALDDVDVSDAAAPVAITAAPAPTWQVNTPEASTDINGVQATATAPAIASFLTSDTATLNIDGTVGLPYDALVAAGPVVAGGTFPSFATPGQQIVNIDWTAAIQFFLNSGTTAPNFLPLPGPVALNFTVPLPAVASTQTVYLDPSFCDQFRLSQATQLTVIDCGTGADLGLGDDTFSQQTLGFNYNFYGTSYSDVFVNANGSVTLGSGSTDFSSTDLELQTQAFGRIAVWWEDFSPNISGVVTWETNGVDTFTARWCGVPGFSTPGSSSDFTLVATDTGAGGTIGFSYDAASTELEGVIGLSGGSAVVGSTLNPVDLSALGGPLAINPTDIIHEVFIDPTSTFDLGGLSLLWTLDPTGVPAVVQ